ncbi:nitrogen regulation protein NR(II) [Rhodoferax sp.]|uniref:two-component system sensor histidine kinase NtrB n=1 Tax=Rhodoferax sp. TaxID=50421 RepID=UPI001EB4B1F9|nr:PAS domain-containing sensor histidine kinase [Rhodoferax sp.]MBT9505364.1 PAS domain-containing sensor histidine kinase [Rhodoferax sp.]
MSQQPDPQTWFAPSLLEPGIEQTDNPQEFERLWRGFMTARVTLGLVLLLLQSVIFALGSSPNATLILICSGYFAAALSVRLMAKPRQLGKAFDSQWLNTLGVDILAFAALQVAQGNSINYAPLFALPVLMASVLGSLLLAMGAAAGVTLLLFMYAAWMSIQVPGDTTAYFLQAALTGAGCFVISFLANQIATRLANEELRAERNQLAVRVQRLVNELVIESLTDGILVVDHDNTVRAANPAARMLLGAERSVRASSFDLASQVGWQGLIDLMKLSFAENAAKQADVTIHHAGQGPRRVRVRTQLTAAQGTGSESLCVMFLQDQREMEARMRTDKLASMGRMSAAVAHEIRNPLAAIAQANALLDEDLSDPRHKQLTQMVKQNAKRLEKIVDDVLNISRVQHGDSIMMSSTLDLNDALERICHDWQEQTGMAHHLRIKLTPQAAEVRFEAEHLRRILVNLLDNARRYASRQLDAIQVSAEVSSMGQSSLSVWSDGQPMDQTVERHLFEPFFSSESRSSGLGLYICRELCEGHGASIAYFRTQRNVRGVSMEGNEFIVTFRSGMDNIKASRLAGAHP